MTTSEDQLPKSESTQAFERDVRAALCFLLEQLSALQRHTGEGLLGTGCAACLRMSLGALELRDSLRKGLDQPQQTDEASTPQADK